MPTALLFARGGTLVQLHVRQSSTVNDFLSALYCALRHRKEWCKKMTRTKANEVQKDYVAEVFEEKADAVAEGNEAESGTPVTPSDAVAMERSKVVGAAEDALEAEGNEAESGTPVTPSDAVAMERSKVVGAAEGVLETEGNEAVEEAMEGEETEDFEENANNTGAEKPGYVDYYLPPLADKPIGSYQTVTINGKNYQVRYGEWVKIPVGVRDILEEMVRQTMLLGKKIERLKEEKCITKIE